MVGSRSGLFFSVFVIFLPACSPPKQEMSQQPAGSTFAHLSEQEIRDDVRQEYMDEKTLGAIELEKNKDKKKRMSRKQKKLSMLEVARTQEARLIDVPLPLDVQPIGDFFEIGEESFGQALGYKTAMPAEQLVDFYAREMERYGWQCFSELHGAEHFASFVKPDRYCSVSVRPHRTKKGCDLVIFTGATATTATT